MRTGTSAGTATLDGTSIDALYRLHAAEAFRVARSITRNPDDAADAVAEAFAGVLQAAARGGLSAPEAFRPYLLAATRNAAVDVVRRSGRLRPTDHPDVLDRASSSLGPSDRLLAGEDRALVAEAFAGLPPRWRAVLWLTEVEQLAPRDAALLLDLTPNNVSQLAVRARSGLRQRYVQLHVRNHAAGDCLKTTEHLAGLVGGDLTTVQENRVRGHLAECATCRARLAELEDLGLSLRRAAMPLPLILWARSQRRRFTAWRTRGATRLAVVDPSATAAISTVASSPAGQQVAAAVAAGLVLLGIGAAVVRKDHSPPRDGRRPPVEVAVPAIDPQPSTTVATPPTSTPVTVPPLEPPTTTTAPAATTATTTAPAPAATATAPAPAAPTTTVAAAPPFTPRGPLANARRSFVAHALVPELAIYDGPAGIPRQALANPQRSGAPLVLLVTEQRGDWLEVLLPVRPNGSKGWIRAQDATVVPHNFLIVVELGAHRITAYQGTDVLVSEPIGVGTADAPTPGGLYYITELFEPLDSAGQLNPDGPYGAYAYGLSGYSEVLFDFGGGDGQFGIHGTNDPSGLGRDISHGCIRMSNDGITRLAGILPLGVPVEILP